MKIVIAGAGEVGSHLAKMLSNEEQDIVIIDSDARKLVSLENYNLMTYQGNATSFRDLKSVRIGSADLFIAVTPYETTNVLACSIAKRLGTKTTVARIDNFEFLSKEHQEFFAQMGVDDLIYPEYLAAEEMRNALHRTWVRNWFELMDGELVVVGVKLRENSRIVGHHLREITHDARTFHVAAIKRNRETIIPRGDDRILANDIAYIATTHEHIDEVAEACGKVNVKVEKVLVVGGNTIAEQLALLLGKDYRIKVIEENLERCEELAARLPDTSVVHGSARDIDLLEEEGIGDYDLFVALTPSSEANILGCMMAKEHGVPKTIAGFAVHQRGRSTQYRHNHQQEAAGIEQNFPDDARQGQDHIEVLGSGRCRSGRAGGPGRVESDPGRREGCEVAPRHDAGRAGARRRRPTGDRRHPAQGGRPRGGVLPGRCYQ